MTPPINSVSDERLVTALADLVDAFLERHGCFPLDNPKWKSAMTEAYDLIGQPNTPDRIAKLAARRAANSPVARIVTEDDGVSEKHSWSASPALPSQVGVSIKPLEWGEADEDASGYRNFDAKSALGTYSVYRIKVNASWTVECGSRRIGVYPGEAEAKTAAQADFNARIRSCLTSPAAEPVENDERRRYHEQIGKLLKLVSQDRLNEVQRAEFDEIDEDHSWDGLSCSCGGGWLVGHRAGCPEDASREVTDIANRIRQINHDLLAVQTDPRFPSSDRVKASILQQVDALLAALPEREG
jgi:hypothetical protein